MRKQILLLLTVGCLLAADEPKGRMEEEARSLSNRAARYILKGDYDKAIAACTKAIRLNPKDTQAYINRGSAYALKGEPAKAIADFDQAIRLDPNDATAYDDRAAAHAAQGDYAKAIKDYQAAMRVNPKKPAPYAHLADLRATCPKAELRDGKKAVQLATKACELTKWSDPISLAALAAAYAEVGDFQKAVKWQKKAVATSGPLVFKRKQDVEEDRQRLRRYEASRPYRRPMVNGGKPDAKDKDALQGTWRVLSAEAQGVTTPVDREFTLTFRGERLHQLDKQPNGADFQYSFKLDSAKDPKTIDMVITKAADEKDQREVGKKLFGIYALDGDKLRLCIGVAGRPTTFATRGKRDTVMLVLQRAKE
jgi:uncharacterized protein (TIGR03067 family)